MGNFCCQLNRHLIPIFCFYPSTITSRRVTSGKFVIQILLIFCILLIPFSWFFFVSSIHWLRRAKAATLRPIRAEFDGKLVEMIKRLFLLEMLHKNFPLSFTTRRERRQSREWSCNDKKMKMVERDVELLWTYLTQTPIYSSFCSFRFCSVRPNPIQHDCMTRRRLWMGVNLKIRHLHSIFIAIIFHSNWIGRKTFSIKILTERVEKYRMSVRRLTRLYRNHIF